MTKIFLSFVIFITFCTVSFGKLIDSGIVSKNNPTKSIATDKFDLLRVSMHCYSYPTTARPKGFVRSEVINSSGHEPFLISSLGPIPDEGTTTTIEAPPESFFLLSIQRSRVRLRIVHILFGGKSEHKRQNQRESCPALRQRSLSKIRRIIQKPTCR